MSDKDTIMSIDITAEDIYKELKVHGEKLDTIEKQVKKTNGRVTENEKCVKILKKNNLTFWVKDRKWILIVMAILLFLLFSKNISESVNFLYNIIRTVK